MWCPGWEPATERKTLGETKEIRMKYDQYWIINCKNVPY